jgi:SAM-dependent methyltransferase
LPTLQDLWKRLPAGPRRWLRQQWFEYLSSLDTGGDLLFLNHGYACREGENPIELLPQDEPQRHPIQLYHHVASAVDWKGKDALEVGCGRGGGAAYVARCFRPHSLTAVDLTGSAIRFAASHHRVEGLRFRRADAHALPFPDASFDIVLNVESSLLYRRAEVFFAEVLRVLRPGGHFLFADYRRQAQLAALRRQLEESGLEWIREEEISSEVAAAMRLEEGRKAALIERYAPGWLRGTFERFAAVGGRGGAEIEEFEQGRRIYLHCVLRRAEEA